MAESKIAHVERELIEFRKEHTEVHKQLHSRLDKLEYAVNNGMSGRIAAAVTTALEEQQRHLWEREMEERRLKIEEQQAQNRAYGAKRDADQARAMARMKLWAAIVPGIIAALGIIVVAFINRGGG